MHKLNMKWLQVSMSILSYANMHRSTFPVPRNFCYLCLCGSDASKTWVLYRHLTQGTERAVLQAPRQTLGVERVRARQPAGAGRVHRGHADAAGRVVVIVGRVRGVPIAPALNTTSRRAMAVTRAPAELKKTIPVATWSSMVIAVTSALVITVKLLRPRAGARKAVAELLRSPL